MISATVVADRAADAGALATAFCVLTPEDSERLAASVPGAEFLIVLADGSRDPQRRLARAGRRVRCRACACRAPVASVYASEQAGKPDHELTVTVELAQFQGSARSVRISRSGSRTRTSSRSAR